MVIIFSSFSCIKLIETGSEDDGLLDMNEDFFVGGSTEADTDDEWRDKSTSNKIVNMRKGASQSSFFITWNKLPVLLAKQHLECPVMKATWNKQPVCLETDFGQSIDATSLISQFTTKFSSTSIQTL